MRSTRTCARGRASATTPASSTRSSPPSASWREGRSSPGGRTRRNENDAWRLEGHPPTRTSEDRMIFRLSHKLNAKIKAGVLRALPLDENPLADWSAHLFVAGRAQYLLVSNTRSLYASVRFAKALDRSVTGSMNDLIKHATYWLAGGDESPFDVGFRLNEIPMSALASGGSAYGKPREVFRALAGGVES